MLLKGRGRIFWWGPGPLQNALSDHPSLTLADNADRSPARTAAVQPVHRWTGKNVEVVGATSLRSQRLERLF